MTTRVFFVLALLGSTFAPSLARAAQPWIADRRYGEGVGIRTGNLELHPGVSGEVGYDSNYFQNSDDATEPEVAAIRFRLTPSLSLKTIEGRRRAELAGGQETDPKVSFDANVSAAYNELIATDSQFSDDVSKQRHLAVEAGLAVDILPKGKWGADLHGDYVRNVQPTNDPASDRAFDRNTIRGGAGVTWRPGGGLFSWRVGYQGTVTFFEDAAYEEFDNVEHQISTRNRWRFLPRTALLTQASVGFVTYSNATSQSNSSPVRASAGMNGLISKHFALLAMVGWGASFYEGAGGDYDSFLAHGEIKWFLQPRPDLESTSASVGLSSIAFGYIRDFKNSYLSDFYTRDRVYTDFSYFIAGRAILGLKGGYSRIEHAASPRVPNDSVEDRVDAQAFAEYRLSDTFGVNLTGQYDASLGDTFVLNAVPPGENLRFSRYQVWLGARWFM